MHAIASVLLAFVFLLAGPTLRPLAAQESWVPTGPAGGIVGSLVIHPDDPRILWAGTSGGVFKSTNGGASWTPTNQGLTGLRISALAVAPSDPETLYAAVRAPFSGTGVFRSTDGGATWTRASASPRPPNPLALVLELAVHPRNPNVVYAATPQGLYKTGTGRGPWGRVLDGDVRSVAIDPVRPAIVYAGGLSEVRKSTNGGGTWSAGVPVGQSTLGILLIDPKDPRRIWAGGSGGLFRTTNGGAFWQPASSGLPNRPVLSLALAPSSGRGADILWAGTTNGTFRSGNGGGTWVRASQGMRGQEINALVAHPRQPGTLWAGSGTLEKEGPGVFKTTNNGMAWRMSNRGLLALHLEVLAFDPQTPGVVWAGTDGRGVFRSADSGATWAPRNSGIEPLTISSLAIAPSGPQTLWATAGRNVFVTHDGGEQWVRRGSGPIDPFNGFIPPVSLLRLDPQDAAVAYAGTSSGLFRTTDEGVTWSRFEAPLPAASVTDLLIDPRDSDVVFVAMGALWVTRDGGATWELVPVANAPIGIAALAADPRNPDVIYAGGASGIVLRSADGGRTWQLSFVPFEAVDQIPWVVSLSVGPTGEVWAATREWVAMSPTGIGSWRYVPGIERAIPEEIAADPHDPDTVLAATSAGLFRYQKGE